MHRRHERTLAGAEAVTHWCEGRKQCGVQRNLAETASRRTSGSSSLTHGAEALFLPDPHHYPTLSSVAGLFLLQLQCGPPEAVLPKCGPTGREHPCHLQGEDTSQAWWDDEGGRGEEGRGGGVEAW